MIEILSEWQQMLNIIAITIFALLIGTFISCIFRKFKPNNFYVIAIVYIATLLFLLIFLVIGLYLTKYEVGNFIAAAVYTVISVFIAYFTRHFFIDKFKINRGDIILASDILSLTTLIIAVSSVLYTADGIQREGQIIGKVINGYVHTVGTENQLTAKIVNGTIQAIASEDQVLEKIVNGNVQTIASESYNNKMMIYLATIILLFLTFIVNYLKSETNLEDAKIKVKKESLKRNQRKFKASIK